MNKRKLRLDKYGISGKRYKELCGFCEQYPEWKKELAETEYPMSAVCQDGMPHNPNTGTSDTTGNIAVRRALLQEKIDIVERSAYSASTVMWKFIIKSVCYEVPVNYLSAVEEMGLSRSAFYELRRYFFYILDKEKK